MKCPKCKGTGKNTCPRCHGRKFLNVPISNPVSHCPKCRTKGKVECTECDGTGEILNSGNQNDSDESK